MQSEYSFTLFPSGKRETTKEKAPRGEKTKGSEKEKRLKALQT